MPKVPASKLRVVYPGGLSPLEHALVDARKWQLKQIERPDEKLNEAYVIIVGLLSCFDTITLQNAYKKGGIS